MLRKVLIVLIPLMLGAAFALAGQDEVPPRVVAVQPVAGEELPLDAPLTIVFNQAMNQDSVAQALSFAPEVAGSLDWTDARTLVFTPDESWARDTLYTVTIGVEAISEAGLPLEEAYSFDVQTLGTLEVVSIQPVADAMDIAADAQITVAFNRPVVPLGFTGDMQNLPSPLTITPAIEGSGEWVNTSIYTFTPDDPLVGGATYTAIVAAGLTDVSGATLAEDFAWTFNTLPPEILSTYPSDGSMVALDDEFNITFSQPMDQASVEEAFNVFNILGNAIDGQISWNDSGTVLTFTPAERLTIASNYQFELDAALAKGLGGANIRNGREFFFQTVPLPQVVTGATCGFQNGVGPGRRTVSIRFNTEMNTETFEGRIVISPLPDEWLPIVYGSGDLGVQFEFEPLTTYTITFLAGAEDIYGNAIPTDFVCSFAVGDVVERVRIPDGGAFVVTGGYRFETALPVSIAGEPTVDLSLYRLPDDRAYLGFRWLYDDEITALLADSNNLVSSWQQTLVGESTFANVKMNVAGEAGGVLPLGSYFLTVDHRFPDTRQVPVAIGVVNSNITVNRSADSLFIWVTDMETAEPLANQEVMIYQGSNAIARGTTDSEGVLRLDLDLPRDEVIITSRAEGRYGLWNISQASIPPSNNIYFYTDRPLYRPDETVYFRGAYRARDDFDYSIVPSLETLYLRVTLNYDAVIHEQDVVMTEFGTFSGEFALPEDAQLGQLDFELYRDGDFLRSFSALVSEFRVPEFSVEVTSDQDEIVAGDDLTFLVNGRFFSGGTVSNAQVNWFAQSVPAFFNYTGAGNYSFSDVGDNFFGFYDDYYYGGKVGGRTIANGQGMTDGSGNLLVELENLQTESSRPETVAFEATLNDESGQFISGRTTALVHPADVYVGIRSEQHFGREGEAMSFDLITVTPESDIIPQQDVDITVVERRWERIEVEGSFGRYDWEVVEEEVATERVTTDENGMVTYSFTPDRAGTYIVRALSRDERERTHQSGLRLWVTGSTPVWWGQPTDRIDLITDAESYTPGDVAEILIPTSRAAWVLVSVEREGVMDYEIVRVDGSTLLYELPITDTYAPGVYVRVTVLHGIDEDNSVPAHRIGSVRLQVEPVQKRIDVIVTPSSTNTQPGETVTFDVLTQDQDGNPVSAEVGLALVDSAILSLTSPNSLEPEQHYYSSFLNYTRAAVMLVALVDGRLDQLFGVEEAPADEGRSEFDEAEESLAFADDAAAPTQSAALPETAGGGGGGFETVEVRQDFQQTPLWEAHLVTDENGRAQISAVMPDNLTIWNLNARALTQDTRVGNTEVDVSSTLPLLVRPAVPRFFVEGDEVTLAMVVNNNTDDAQTVQTTMQGTGFELVEDETLEKTVEIASTERARVEWRVRIMDVEFVDLTFIALGEDGFQDASKPTLATGPDGTIPVYRYTAPDTTGTGGVLFDGGSRTEGIVIPPFTDTDQGELTLQLDPSLAVTTIDALDYLRNFEHQCIEQTVSRFLPNVMTFRALRDLGVEDAMLESLLRSTLDQSLQMLRTGQNPDGGWGWFVGMRSSEIVTAYAILGLIEAQEAGFDIDPNMIDRGVNFLRTDLINPTEDTEVWRLNRQAFYFYVLSRAARYFPSLAEMDALFNVRLEMSIYAKAYLLMAYQAVSPNSQSQKDALINDLVNSVSISATGAHWEESFRDWWNWGSDTRTTAIVLAALIETQGPDNPILPNAVRWLMVARQGDHWETTQETAWSVMALTDWMVATNELQGNYDYSLIFNGDSRAEGNVTPETVRDGQTLNIAVNELLMDEINRVTVSRTEGEGALYYTAHLRLRLDADEVEPIDRGVSVVREYFVEDSEAPDGLRPVSEVEAGEIVTVRLTVTTRQSMFYFVLEDPLPAGVEALDTSLLTTTQGADDPRFLPQRNSRFYWYWWVWDHSELRDEQVNLYADELPRGTYVFSYQVQAITPGVFQTMPAHGYAFYFPEVFGRSNGQLFTVTASE